MPDKTQNLQSLLNSQIGKGGLHNIVAAVQSCDKSLDFVGAEGVADPAAGALMTPETPYFIASVTKMYTAAIIMQLHEQKRLDLETPARIIYRLTCWMESTSTKVLTTVATSRCTNWSTRLPDWLISRLMSRALAKSRVARFTTTAGAISISSYNKVVHCLLF